MVSHLYPSSSFLQAVYEMVGWVVDPVMRPIRSVLPPPNLGGMALDLSPPWDMQDSAVDAFEAALGTVS
jgi:uncharacterized protein YggT (Ycf19 family)